MELEVQRGRTSTARRSRLIRLFEEHNLLANFIERHWPFGSTPGGVAERRRCLRFGDKYDGCQSGRGYAAHAETVTKAGPDETSKIVVERSPASPSSIVPLTQLTSFESEILDSILSQVEAYRHGRVTRRATTRILRATLRRIRPRLIARSQSAKAGDCERDHAIPLRVVSDRILSADDLDRRKLQQIVSRMARQR
jgi:hypothetical protein